MWGSGGGGGRYFLNIRINYYFLKILLDKKYIFSIKLGNIPEKCHVILMFSWKNEFSNL